MNKELFTSIISERKGTEERGDREWKHREEREEREKNI